MPRISQEKQNKLRAFNEKCESDYIFNNIVNAKLKSIAQECDKENWHESDIFVEKLFDYEQTHCFGFVNIDKERLRNIKNILKRYGISNFRLVNQLLCFNASGVNYEV